MSVGPLIQIRSDATVTLSFIANGTGRSTFLEAIVFAPDLPSGTTELARDASLDRVRAAGGSG